MIFFIKILNKNRVANSSFLLLFLLLFQNQLESQILRIPFRYVQSFIIIEVKLENVIPVRLIFDTGAEHNLLFDKAHTDLISQAYLREIKILGSDLSVEIPALLTDTLRINIDGKLEKKTQFISLKESNYYLSQIIGERVDGILSAKIFSDKVFEIDYKKAQINIYENRPSDKKLSQYQECKIHVYKNKPYVFSDLSISNSDSVYNMNFLLDTGAGLGVLVYKDEQSTLQIPDKILPGRLGTGIGGIIEGYTSRSKFLHFCTTRYEDVVSNFQRVSGRFYETESKYKQGLIGNQILDNYKVIFDYATEKMYLKRSKEKTQYIYDRSGISIIAGGPYFDQYYVAHIVPGSPADLARIQVGDRVKGVNGIPVVFLSLNKIHKRLSKPNKQKISLKLSRNGKKIKRTVFLKDLI